MMLLLEANKPLADRIAIRTYTAVPDILSLDELKVIAQEALVEAVSAWEPFCAEHLYDATAIQYFPAFASNRIKRHVYHVLRTKGYIRPKVKKVAKDPDDTP